MAYRSNVDLVAQRMHRRADAITREQRRAAQTIAKGVSQEAHSQQEALIYSKPIPTSSTGKPLWKRSGRLKQDEKAQTVGRWRESVVLVNRRPYAKRRHEQKKFKYASPAPWRTIAVTKKRAWILEQRRAAVLRALRVR